MHKKKLFSMIVALLLTVQVAIPNLAAWGAPENPSSPTVGQAGEAAPAEASRDVSDQIVVAG